MQQAFKIPKGWHWYRDISGVLITNSEGVVLGKPTLIQRIQKDIFLQMEY
jgi:hypothetical protein